MKKTLLILGVCTLLFAACKPTEKNYREAYSKAYEAAQRRAEKETTSTDGARLEATDGMRYEQVGQESVAVVRGRVKSIDETVKTGKAKTGLAVAKYKVNTNARRNVEDLKADYPEAFVATNGSDEYFVVVAVFPALTEAPPYIEEFRKHYPEYHYMGLEGRPAVVFF